MKLSIIAVIKNIENYILLLFKIKMVSAVKNDRWKFFFFNCRYLLKNCKILS